MNKKYILIGLAGLTLYFLVKKKEDKPIEEIAQATDTAEIDFSNKIEKIKVNIFNLIEAFHYKYKSATMTDNDLTEYEKMINKITE